MQESMLTTTDNPFDPFTQFDEWFAFDEGKGYQSSGLVARIAKTSDSLSDVDEGLAIEAAIDHIIELNLSGNHTKVTRIV